MVIVITASFLRYTRPFRSLVSKPGIVPILVECQDLFDTHSIDKSPILTLLLRADTNYPIADLRLLAYLRLAGRQCAKAVEGVRRTATVVWHDVDVEPWHVSSHETMVPVAVYEDKPGVGGGAAGYLEAGDGHGGDVEGGPLASQQDRRQHVAALGGQSGRVQTLSAPAPPPLARRPIAQGVTPPATQCLVSALQCCLVRCRLTACPRRRTWRSRSDNSPTSTAYRLV